MNKFVVCDESKCGKGEQFDRRRMKYLGTFDTLKEAEAFAKNKKGEIAIEEWDMEEGIYLTTLVC